MRRAAFGVLGAVLALGWMAAVHAADPKPAGRVPMPTVTIEKGEKCVEPTEEMRRNHMEMILHQRDRTLHDGIRSVKHSLKNCIDCHANPKTNSVLGKDGFCESCHAYAAVSMDCFECHSSSPRKDAADKKPGSSRVDMQREQLQRVTAPVKGTAP
jgi:uncharacterized Fe-S radical SAM superfamily protein PflX